MKDEQEEPKRIMKKSTNILLKFIFIIGGLLAGYYGFKLFIVLITTPILSVYNAATNLYVINNDPSVFLSASTFASGYMNAWIFLSLGLFIILFVKAIRKKTEEKYARD